MGFFPNYLLRDLQRSKAFPQPKPIECSKIPYSYPEARFFSFCNFRERYFPLVGTTWLQLVCCPSGCYSVALCFGSTSEAKKPAHAFAAIVSIVETCRRLKIPVQDYLGSVLPGLADFPINRVAELTPSAWAARN
jgi:hypothetical protein